MMKSLRTGKTDLLSVIFLLVIFSCTDTPESREAPEDQSDALLGTWSNTDLRLVLKNERDSVIVLNQTNWTDVLGILPIVSEFREDSTYTSTYYSPEGEVIMTTSGIWYIRSDSLHMIEREVPNTYHYQVEGDTVTFRGWVDWDQDGEVDDLYEGRQVRQRQ